MATVMFVLDRGFLFGQKLGFFLSGYGRKLNEFKLNRQEESIEKPLGITKPKESR